MKETFRDYERNKNYEKATKNQAFSAWKKGVEVIICPKKMHPFGTWRCGMEFPDLERAKKEEQRFNEDIRRVFDRIVTGFEWYNCTAETGKFAAFYVKIGE